MPAYWELYTTYYREMLSLCSFLVLPAWFPRPTKINHRNISQFVFLVLSQFYNHEISAQNFKFFKWNYIWQMDLLNVIWNYIFSFNGFPSITKNWLWNWLSIKISPIYAMSIRGIFFSLWHNSNFRTKFFCHYFPLLVTQNF